MFNALCIMCKNQTAGIVWLRRVFCDSPWVWKVCSWVWRPPVAGDSSWLGGPDYSSLFHLQPTNHQDLDDNEEKEKSTKIIILTENVCFSFNEVLISDKKIPNFWLPSIFWLPPSPSGVHSHQAAQLHQERMWVEPFLAAGSCRKRCGLRVHGVPATLNGKQNG